MVPMTMNMLFTLILEALTLCLLYLYLNLLFI